MQRLSPLDAMFLHQDSPTVPRQVASLAILEPGAKLDHDRLVHVINERIDLVPRYRQIPRFVPGGLGTPVWLDDENFDISLHVRRSALPRPGGQDALHELVGRLIARRLDLDRALWELYLIEGYQGNRARAAVQGAPGPGRRLAHHRPGAGAAGGVGQRARHPARGVAAPLRRRTPPDSSAAPCGTT